MALPLLRALQNRDIVVGVVVLCVAFAAKCGLPLAGVRKGVQFVQFVVAALTAFGAGLGLVVTALSLILVVCGEGQMAVVLVETTLSQVVVAVVVVVLDIVAVVPVVPVAPVGPVGPVVPVVPGCGWVVSW